MQLLESNKFDGRGRKGLRRCPKIGGVPLSSIPDIHQEVELFQYEFQPS